MDKNTTSGIFPAIRVDWDGPGPHYRRIYQALRDAIHTGTLTPGQRLPSSRVAAETLGVSRSTIIEAWDQLESEGYIESKRGSGTFVSPEWLKPPVKELGHGRGLGPIPGLAGYSRFYEDRISERGFPKPFRPDIPALDSFPIATWARLSGRWAGKISWSMLDYPDPRGYLPLRQAILDYLRVARGIQCGLEQVVVTGGTRASLNLLAKLVASPETIVWAEDPGYRAVYEAFSMAGCQVRPIPAGQEGIAFEHHSEDLRTPHVIYVTPSHQYPLGTVMTAPRRSALLDWASKTGTWIIEDDYDSEYRYASHPLPALRSLDTMDQVIYLGTFSKVLAPGLRLGYAVLPVSWVESYVAMKLLWDHGSSLLVQTVLADFIQEGYFVRHIRRTRKLYGVRRQTFVDEAQQCWGQAVRLQPSDAGLHMVGWLSHGWDDRLVSTALSREGIEAPPLSGYRRSCSLDPGLIFGYAAYWPEQIREAVRKAAAIFSRMEIP